MKTNAVFYHAGCPVCVAAEQAVANALDPARYEVEIGLFGNSRGENGSHKNRFHEISFKSLCYLILPVRLGDHR